MLMSKQIAETVNAAMAVLPEELRQAIRCARSRA
jgi:RNA polymerase sigma-70 factor (ECF subfamily)